MMRPICLVRFKPIHIGGIVPQSHSKVYVHLVYSTKHRVPLIMDEVRNSLHEYVGGILRQIECPAVVSGSHVDHVHTLFLLSRKVAIANVVEEVKTATSKWMKKQSESLAEFYWQNGYGSFSVSESNVPDVKKYIENQAEHHRKMTFQQEYRELLRRHKIEFDERYVWD